MILENHFLILENEFLILKNEFLILENEFLIFENTDFCPQWLAVDCQWQNVNLGTMLGQRCTSNPNHRPTVLPYANVGPT